MKLRLFNRRGQGTLEYILIAAGVIFIAIYLIRQVQPKAQQKVDGIASDLK